MKNVREKDRCYFTIDKRERERGGRLRDQGRVIGVGGIRGEGME